MLEARTGLDRAMIRRALVADLDGVTLDEAFRRDGEARLERLRELGPVTLPEVIARDDDRDVRDRVAAILEEVLDGAERVALADVVLLAQLVQDARLFALDLRGALALRDACTLWETTA